MDHPRGPDLMKKICHRLNPLHVFCRLKDRGWKRKRISYWVRKYERVVKFLKKNWPIMGAIIFALFVIFRWAPDGLFFPILP